MPLIFIQRDKILNRFLLEDLLRLSFDADRALMVVVMVFSPKNSAARPVVLQASYTPKKTPVKPLKNNSLRQKKGAVILRIKNQNLCNKIAFAEAKSAWNCAR